MCNIRYERVVIMKDIKNNLGYQLDYVVMWETPNEYKIPIAAFKLKSDAELFVINSDLKERMEIINTNE